MLLRKCSTILTLTATARSLSMSWLPSWLTSKFHVSASTSSLSFLFWTRTRVAASSMTSSLLLSSTTLTSEYRLKVIFMLKIHIQLMLLFYIMKQIQITVRLLQSFTTRYHQIQTLQIHLISLIIHPGSGPQISCSSQSWLIQCPSFCSSPRPRCLIRRGRG